MKTIGVEGDVSALEDELRLTADELRLSARHLATTSARLAATLNAVTDGITVQAPGGQLILANDTAARWLGFASVADLLAGTPET
jgi:PAS domain-containing protein